MKAERVQVSKLSRDRPREVIAVPWDDTNPVSSEATVYASVRSRLTGPAAVVGVRLVAGLMGERQLVGTAAFAPGQSGIGVIASGIVADAWHVEAYGGGEDTLLTVELGIRQCCSGFAAYVPPERRIDIPPVQGETMARCSPLTNASGTQRYITGAAGVAQLVAGDKLQRVQVRADPLVAATVAGLPGGAWTIPAARVWNVAPAGAISGPLAITFTNTEFFLVEVNR